MKEIPLGFNRAVENQAAQRNTNTTQAAVFLISTITVSDITCISNAIPFGR